MTPFMRRIIGGILATLLLTAMATACGGSGDGGGDAADAGGDLTSMLRLVPAGADTDLITISLFDRALEVADIEITGEPEEQGHERERLTALGGDPAGPVDVAPSQLIGIHRLSGDLDTLLFRPSALRAEIAVGNPPDMILMGVGETLDETLLDDAEAVDGVESGELGDTRIATWLGDNEMDPTVVGPLGPNPSQAGRLAVPTSGVLAHATNDAALSNVLDAFGDGETLADVDGILAVAEALDEADVIAAHLTTQPVQVIPDLTGKNPGLEGEGLQPYDVLGIGASVVDGEPRLVLALHHAADEMAEANAEILAGTIADELDIQTGRPWSEILTGAEVEADGRVVTMIATPVSPRLWSQLLMTRSSLLAVD